jgi:hypothetical protein
MVAFGRLVFQKQLLTTCSVRTTALAARRRLVIPTGTRLSDLFVTLDYQLLAFRHFPEEEPTIRQFTQEKNELILGSCW